MGPLTWHHVVIDFPTSTSFRVRSPSAIVLPSHFDVLSLCSTFPMFFMGFQHFCNLKIKPPVGLMIGESKNYWVSLAWILQVFEGQWHPMPTYYYLYSNKNRYVVDMGRTMLKHSGLPKKKVLNCTSVHNILNSLYPVKLPLRPCMAQSPFGLIFGSLMVRHLFIIMLLKKNRNKAPCQFHGQTHKHPFFILFLFDYDLGMSFGQPLDFLFI